MKLNGTIAAAALLASVAVLGMTTAGAADAPAKEKCYGVVKAGANDCKTASNSCAGNVKADGQNDAFIELDAGVCERLVGGSTTPTLPMTGLKLRLSKNGGATVSWYRLRGTFAVVSSASIRISFASRG